MKAAEDDIRTGKLIIIRSQETEKRMNERRAYVRSRGIHMNEFMRQSIIKTNKEQVIVRDDEFPSQLPENVRHVNIWLPLDYLSGWTLSAVVAETLDFFHLNPQDAVFTEKRRIARHAAQSGQAAFKPGIMPSVDAIRHVHAYLYAPHIDPSRPFAVR